MIPKISIIVPIYNVEQYLNRCMQSLLNQTLKEIEIILVDDESPDNCPAMCDKYARHDSRIKVIHKKNGGLGFARNSGLEIATGEYVAFVDSDDYVDTRMYETLYKYAVEYKTDMVSSGHFFEVNHKLIGQNDVQKLTIFEGDEIKEICLDLVSSKPKIKKERQYAMSVWHGIYSTSLIKKNHILFLSERTVVAEDLPFQVDILLRATKIAYIPDFLYYYCSNEISLSSTFNSTKFYKLKILRQELIKRLKQIDKQNIRVNRAFIGRIHSHIQKLVKSNDSIKIKLSNLKSVCDDLIWEELKTSYPYQLMPIINRLEIILIFNKLYRSLYVYISLVIFVKNHK